MPILEDHHGINKRRPVKGLGGPAVASEDEVGKPMIPLLTCCSLSLKKGKNRVNQCLLEGSISGV